MSNIDSKKSSNNPESPNNLKHDGKIELSTTRFFDPIDQKKQSFFHHLNEKLLLKTNRKNSKLVDDLLEEKIKDATNWTKGCGWIKWCRGS